MSNLGPFGGQANSRIPTPPRGETIARYDTYLEAQRAVDFLSDEHFPVQLVTIVGSGLRMVERVTGRLSYPRVAVAGAASGAWFGLFVGVLLSLFGGGAELGLFAAVFIGAGFGMLFGVISYAFTGGRRDFTSTSQIVAGEYEVLCMPEHAGQARELLSRLPGSDAARGVPAAGDMRAGISGTVRSGDAPSSQQRPTGVTGPAGVDLPPPSVPPVSTTPPEGLPAAGGEQVAEAAPEGLTYGEVMQRRRQEQREREARERAEQERLTQEGSTPEGSAREPGAEDPR
ncbi:MAG: hypothetical protein P8Z68_01030 [Kineosporiaceae bacterium]